MRDTASSVAALGVVRLAATSFKFVSSPENHFDPSLRLLEPTLHPAFLVRSAQKFNTLAHDVAAVPLPNSLATHPLVLSLLFHFWSRFLLGHDGRWSSAAQSLSQPAPTDHSPQNGGVKVVAVVEVAGDGGEQQSCVKFSVLFSCLFFSYRDPESFILLVIGPIDAFFVLLFLLLFCFGFLTRAVYLILTISLSSRLSSWACSRSHSRRSVSLFQRGAMYSYKCRAGVEGERLILRSP